jgi:hypothetical protein
MTASIKGGNFYVRLYPAIDGDSVYWQYHRFKNSLLNLFRQPWTKNKPPSTSPFSKTVAKRERFIRSVSGVLRQPDLTSANRMARDKKGRIYVWGNPAFAPEKVGRGYGPSLPNIRRYDTQGRMDKSFLVETIHYFSLHAPDGSSGFPHRIPTSDDILGVCFPGGAGCHAVNQDGRWKQDASQQNVITRGENYRYALRWPPPHPAEYLMRRPAPSPDGIVLQEKTSQGWRTVRTITIGTKRGVTTLFYTGILAISSQGDVAFVAHSAEAPRAGRAPKRINTPPKVSAGFYILPPPNGETRDPGILRPFLTMSGGPDNIISGGEFFGSGAGTTLVWSVWHPNHRKFYRWRDGVLSATEIPWDRSVLGWGGVFVDSSSFAYFSPRDGNASPIQILHLKGPWDELQPGR